MSRPRVEGLEERSLLSVSVTDYAIPFPVLNNNLGAITSGPDGNLWFAEPGKGSIGRMTPSGAVTEFSLNGAAPPASLISGPDGNLWFTGSDHSVSKMTTSGAVTRFNVTGTGITSGPDGNLWIASGNSIIRMTPSGSVTSFPVPALPNGALAQAIATGSDGALWFTAPLASTVVRMTTTGATTSYPYGFATGINAFGRLIEPGPGGALWFTIDPFEPIPHSLSPAQVGQISASGSYSPSVSTGLVTTVTGIAIGVDGNGWISEATGQFARITPSGGATQFPLPSGGGPLEGITAGPDGALWATDASGRIDRITTAGVVTTFPLTTTYNPTPPPGTAPAPLAIAPGPDSALWFTEPGTGSIGRITTDGSISQFPVGSTSPFGIAPGPDGALWYTESYGSPALPPAAVAKVGRITPEGTVTDFALANNGKTLSPMSLDVAQEIPRAIAAGPDGAVWFTVANNATEFSATPNYQSEIGRISIDGTVQLFSLSEQQGAPGAIVAGPDGALWFTVSGSTPAVQTDPTPPAQWGRIGRISTNGTITEYNLASAGSDPAGITVGPDGALWFTEQGTNEIGRITTAGALTEFPLPQGASAPFAIVTGPDGNLWFTERSATDSIGRITPAGVVTTYTIATGSARLGGIALGTDGNLWVAESGANTIARVVIDRTLAATSGPAIFATSGAPFTGTVATFAIASGAQPGALSATIVWGDGTSSVGSVAISAGGAVTVTGSHTYGAAGTFTALVTLTSASGSAETTAGHATVTAAPPAAPVVVSLRREGVHMHRTHIILTFSEPMDASTVLDLANYTLIPVGPAGHVPRKPRTIPIQSAVYDPVTDSATLTPEPLLPLQRTFRLTVNGMPPMGLESAAGVLLDGSGAGTAGSDAVIIFRGFGSLTSNATTHSALAKHARSLVHRAAPGLAHRHTR